MSANTLQRYGHLPPHRSTGDYAYLEQVVRIGFPVLDARAFLRRHLGNQWAIGSWRRSEGGATAGPSHRSPSAGRRSTVVLAERTLPDGTPASYYTPEDLVEIPGPTESEFGGPVSPLQPRDKIILHVPVASYLAARRLQAPRRPHHVRSLRRRSARFDSGVGRTRSPLRRWVAMRRIGFVASLFIFQHLMTTVTERIDGLPQMTNPMVVDPKFLPWLASWWTSPWMRRCPCISSESSCVARFASSYRRHERGHRGDDSCAHERPVVEEHHSPAPAILGRMTLAGGRNIEERYLRREPPGHFLLREDGSPACSCLASWRVRMPSGSASGERIRSAETNCPHRDTGEAGPRVVAFFSSMKDVPR